MDPAATREVGQTGLRITQFGLGGVALGLAPGHEVDENSWDALETAWRGGVRFFDTAPFYGKGESERRLGRFLRAQAGQPYVLSTKVGRLLEVPPDARRGPDGAKGGPRDFAIRYDYSRAGVLRSLEDSLQRLGVTAIDLAVVHDLDLVHRSPQARMDAHTDQLLISGWPALRELKAAGVIRAIGFGINDFGLIGHWLDLFDPDFFLVAGPYTLMEQGALAEDLPRCVDRGVSVIIGTALGGGLLASRPEPGARYWYRPATDDNLDRASRLNQVCKEFDVPVVAAALQFPFGHPAVVGVIPGAKNGAEVEANLAAFRHPVPAQLWETLKAQGLLHPDAPVPTAEQAR